MLMYSLGWWQTSTVGGHAYLADYDSDKKIRHVGSHLACFYGGNWLLGKLQLCYFVAFKRTELSRWQIAQ
jgi:hypothetical protein